MSRRAVQRGGELERENRRLRRENATLRRQLRAEQRKGAADRARLQAENLQLQQRVRGLRRQMWGKKSERSRGRKKPPMQPSSNPPQKTSDQPRCGLKHGPKPFDPNLPRVTIKLPDPEAQALICPVTGERMRPGFTETIAVLEIIPASALVKRFERTVFVSEGKSAPVCTPWPENVFARHRVEASVFGHIAAEHYCEHAPFNRVEKRLARSGVRLPRATQVALMKKLDQLVKPAVDALKDQLMKKDYIHLDATPIPLCDPARPGGTVESTVWGYRANDEPLAWYHFESARGKSPDHPDRELKAANYEGLLQVDGANGLSEIGVKGQVIALGCLSHARRYAYKAVEDGDRNADVYLEGFNRIFRIDRLAKHFKLGEAKRQALRMTHSLAIFDLLSAMAQTELPEATPKTLYWDCLHYLVEQEEYLRRCITTPGAELTNNAAERNLRPLKTGVRNWFWVGHPTAGPRLANLFTLIENCRQAGVNVEAYVTDLVTRLPGHPARKIAELLPAAWRNAREKTKAAADPPAA
jgi:transposase